MPVCLPQGEVAVRLRRRQYYTMPNFRQYENRTGHILVQWSLGSPLHFAGWHCSWCFTPEGIYFNTEMQT